MKRYIYRGPVSSIKVAGVARALIDGVELELPDDHAHVRSLIARGHLREVVPAPVAQPKPANTEPKTKLGELAKLVEPKKPEPKKSEAIKPIDPPKTNEPAKADEGPRSKRDGQKGVI